MELTIENWLGENNQLGIDIWHKKYQYNNESFSEWLNRISGGDKEVAQIIYDKKFLFGGRILATRGIDDGTKASYSNCFVKGSKVLTDKGLKCIEDITVGDMVLSDDNQYHKVNNTLQRKYVGDLYKLESCNFLEPIICTPNHQFLTNRGWKRADRIFACSPQITAQDKIKLICPPKHLWKEKTISILDKFIPRENTKIEIENNKAQKYVYINNSYQRRSYPVNQNILINDEFAYFIGRWLGDGSVTTVRGQKNPSILQIVFNATTEKESCEICKKIGENAFGIEGHITKTKQNVLALRFENEIVASWFINHFGEKCEGKYVPNEFLGCFPMVLGLCDADGTLNTHGRFRIVLKNKQLIEWLYYSLWYNGICASNIKPVSKQKDTYEFQVTCAIANNKLNPYLTKNYFDKRNEKIAKNDPNYTNLTNITILENQECDVYNLSVEETHTYNINGAIVHNCYVLEAPKDSIESIYDTCKNLARTYSYGGGAGIDISNLAPEGAKVNNQAKTTSGAVSFMDTFSQVTQQICQKGRRGALMISLDCSHPDLEKFITIKNDLNKVNYANISVRVTDDFMLAVQNNLDWELYFERPETNERISKIVKAKDIFRLLCESNWNYAEPGILFWDSIKSHHLQSENEEFNYAGVNPCLVGETLITTTKGEIQIKDLVGQTPDVYCMDGGGNLTIRKATKVWMTRKNAQVVTVHTSRGEIKCTPDHLIHTRNRGWIQAQDLQHGDKLTGLNRQMKGEKHLSVGLTGSKYFTEHRLVAGYYYDIIDKDIHHIDGDTFNNSIDNLEVLTHSEHSIITNTDRHINPIRNNKGQFVTKLIKKKRNSINQENNAKVGVNWFVQDVTWEQETQDVYDMTVPEYHNFVANRIVVHNCAEEPLPANGACLLGSINLSAFVKNGEFDFDDYIKTIRIAVKALDTIQTEGSEKHPLEVQRRTAKDWKQIGLGVMGIADMLIKLKLTYGSKESLNFCNKIANLLTITALDTSADLAKELGRYPKYNESVLKSTFLNQHCDLYTEKGLSLYLKIKDNGLRNSQLLTIAPTGTLSTMLGISGGIEPIFANSYTRTTKTLHDKDVVYKVYTPIVEEYMKTHNLQTEEELPEWFVTSATIPIEQRIAMQSIWQFHIDASISSTINLPNEATVEDVEKLYMLAWMKGLKGITVYRTGCAREGILNTSPKEKESTMNIGLERHLTTGCGTLHVVAFFDEKGNLKNTYLSKGSTGGCNNFMISLSRMISLAARNNIPLEKIIDQLNSCGTCPSYATRRATKHDTSPGSCCPVAVANALKDMYKEITKTEFNINNIDIDSSKTKLTFTEQETNTCPECGGELKHEMGCVTCTSCGYSKCG